MPIYEYRCNQCQKEFNELVLDSEKSSQVICKECGSSDLTKLMSCFAYHRSEEDRLAEFDTSKPPGEEFYKDSRNVGLWAKKRAKELGADLGPQFDEIVDKARSVRNLDDIEKISER
jgi:putative FmdB family regulatory protein